jgi:hypothetical protein
VCLLNSRCRVAVCPWGGPKQIRAYPIFAGVLRIEHLYFGVEPPPIDQGESPFLYAVAEPGSDLPAACKLSNICSLAPSPSYTDPKSYRGHLISADGFQTGCAYLPVGGSASDQVESHFRHDLVERGNDLRAPCRLSNACNFCRHSSDKVVMFLR